MTKEPVNLIASSLLAVGSVDGLVAHMVARVGSW